MDTSPCMDLYEVFTVVPMNYKKTPFFSKTYANKACEYIEAQCTVVLIVRSNHFFLHPPAVGSYILIIPFMLCIRLYTVFR